MKFIASYRWRIFVVAWSIYSIHFATNIVREHYPAFSLAEHGTFHVDEYQGFHPDIFIHTDGHSVIGNQVFVSTLAAIPLFVFDPVLDWLERYSRERLAAGQAPDSEYRTHFPMAADFYRLVSERGLELRFGAAAVVTSVFFMAPATALFLVGFFEVLRRRLAADAKAAELTLLLGFGTPIFFRTSTLNHNLFVMYFMFAAFALLWIGRSGAGTVSLRNRLLAGLLGGLTLTADYVGAVIGPLLWGYLVWTEVSVVPLRKALIRSLAMVLGSVPAILFLFYSQWAMYGNPFLPGQFWMPVQNEYVELGTRGFDWPAWDLLLMNLFHPGYGIYTWAPILLLGLIPVARYGDSLVLPRRERRFVAISFVALLLFCSANQYARLQWNSGFRYLIPIVPFLFLALSDHWIRMPRWARAVLAVPVLFHSWVLTVFRQESIGESYALLIREGVQLPWFRVLRMTSAPDNTLANSGVIPALILTLTVGCCVALWRHGSRIENGLKGG